MKAITFAVVLLFFTSILSFAQPGIVWERTYFTGNITSFEDVHETSDGGFIVAGLLHSGPLENACVFRFNSIGDPLWYVSANWDYQKAQWIEELSDSGFIATGVCRVNPGDSYAFHLLRIDRDGEIVWSKVYDIENSTEYGTCVTPLPDGGFAVCAYRSSTSSGRQAWILRTDMNGDTLWTREWGWDYNDEARRIIFEDGGLTVLTQGRLETTSGGPHIVRYDLDGNLLWETPIPDMYGYYGRDMCYSPLDGCYTIVTYYGPWIAHTDSLGVCEWIIPGRGASNPRGYSINTTMDQGYIYAGQSTPDPETPGTTYSGMIVKYDSEGNEMWWDYVYNSDCDGLFSARQLSQGGYIAAGIANSLTTSREGYLIRYEPEVGIEGGGGLPGTVQLEVSPNPFSSSLGISFNLPETAQVELSVYDFTGRLVENLESGSISAGENISVWNPDPSLPNSCYLIVLDTFGERAARRCVKLD